MFVKYTLNKYGQMRQKRFEIKKKKLTILT